MYNGLKYVQINNNKTKFLKEKENSCCGLKNQINYIERDKEKEIDALKDWDQVYLVFLQWHNSSLCFFFFCFKNNSLILNFSILFGVFF